MNIERYIHALFLISLLVGCSSFFPSEIPASLVIQSLTDSILPQSLGVYRHLPPPFEINGGESINDFLEGKTPSSFHSSLPSDVVKRACTLTRKGELDTIFTYVPSLSIVVPEHENMYSDWDKFIFPNDGVELKESVNDGAEVITSKRVEDVVEGIRTNLIDSGMNVGVAKAERGGGWTLHSFELIGLAEGSKVVVYGIDGTSDGTHSRLTILTVGDSKIDVMKACEPRKDEESVDCRLIPCPSSAFSYLGVSSLDPPAPTRGKEYLSSYVKNVSPFDCGMYDLVSVGKTVCYTGSESFKNSWRRMKTSVDGVKGFKGKRVEGKRGMVRVRFNAVLNEDRAAEERPRDGEAKQEYLYPPKMGADVHIVNTEVVGDKYYDSLDIADASKIGTLTSAFEGFEDSVGLGLITKTRLEKAGYKSLEELDGKVVYAGGSIGTIEALDYPEFVEIQDEEEEEEEEEGNDDLEAIERAEREAREAMERLEKLKAKAEAAMARRKAKK